MDYKKTDFIISVASPKNLYESELPEIAVAGKSNVGKSSFINMLAGRKKLAKVSSSPGRTRLINYFDFDGRFILTDLPGYGYAKVSKEEKAKWGGLVEGYLQSSRKLKRVILLLDCRHDPTQDDLLMINYLHLYAIPFTVVLTKSDKLSRTQMGKSRDSILRKIKMTPNDIMEISSLTKSGREEVQQMIERIILDCEIG